MHIRIFACGKLKDQHLAALIQEYQRRLQWPVSITEIDGRDSAAMNAKLLTAIQGEAVVFLLDEGGKNMDSVMLAKTLQRYDDVGQGGAFVIGPADGLSTEVKARATHTLAFGAATWPHMLVRLMLVEQLYRAESILKGHPYHRV